jgi:hypothetical protein
VSNAPSRPLLVLLALSVLAAAYVYGRPLIAGGDDDQIDEPIVPVDLGFIEETTDPEVDPWTPPADPRNPFLEVDIDADTDTDADADVESDVDADADAEFDVDIDVDAALTE